MIVNPQYGQSTGGSGGPIHGTIYVLTGQTTVSIPAANFTVQCWGPGADNGLVAAGGSGAWCMTTYSGMTSGASYSVNVEAHNTASTDKWTWFDSIATQKAHGGLANGNGGDPAKCIGDVIFGGGNSGTGAGPGGAGAAGPSGPGNNGGNSPGSQPGGGGGGGQGGGTAGADGIVAPASSGGDGGQNAAGQSGGAGGALGAPGADATNPGSGGGGAGFNDHSTGGGAGADDPDNGGGGGGGANWNELPRKQGGDGGFPGRGAGYGSGTAPSSAIGGDGQIKIVY